MATWNTSFNTAPAGTVQARTGAADIRLTRKEYYDRKNKEHVLLSTNGLHREGSAKVYYQSTAPLLRPDALTTLDTNDTGRVWIDSTPAIYPLNFSVYDGSTFSYDYTGLGSSFPYQIAGVFWKWGSGGYSTSFSRSTPYSLAIAEISSWDMDSTASINVYNSAGPITPEYLPMFLFSQIVINGDTGSFGYSFIAGDGDEMAGHITHTKGRAGSPGALYENTSTTFSRASGGFFDGAAFNTSNTSRGFWALSYYRGA